ncbi:BN159_2729 family protein [Streptomyces sp. NPDC005017]|uniref:BN159_2729 family protein n=1 Tax=Streptomyces sp. NPDC005017 TaxID=3364706 RepID=UPI0036A21161
MSEDLSAAVGTVPAALASVPHDPAATSGRPLGSAHGPVGPDRFTAAVLHRTSDGGWSRTSLPAADGRPDDVVPTDLERQAIAWDIDCRRARRVAQSVEREAGRHPGLLAVDADGDTVRVLLRVPDLAEWARWRAYFGITVVSELSRPHLLTGEGRRHGVRVSVLGRITGASETATPVLEAVGPVSDGTAPLPDGAVPGGEARTKRLFRLGGITYDLVQPYRDAHGDIWYFQGAQTAEGMPLMSLDGRPERCSLANVAAYVGPLTPVRAAGPGRGARR